MPKLQKVRLRFKRLSYQSAIIILSIPLILRGLDVLFPLNLDRFQDCSPVVLDQQQIVLSVLLAKDERYRMPLSLKEVDPQFLKFLIAYEDKRFHDHWGVDFLAMGRALWQWSATGKVISGGSTLSMQTARLLEPRSRTLGNKCKEALRAIQLEYHYSKEQILEMYLRLAPYGGNIEGIRAACFSYFNKEPRHLTPSEAALLVALPQQPTRLRPYLFPARARYHRDKVIKRMESIGILSTEQSIEARKDGVPNKKKALPKLSLHLAHHLSSEAGDQRVFYTSLNASLQQQVETLLKQEIQSLDLMHSIAVLIIDNKAQEVLTYVGSADFFDDKRCGQVDMISAVRSPGSILKPFIYAMGFEQKCIHPETIIQDVATQFKDYAPSNFKDVFHGAVTMREALQYSLNVPAVAVLEKIGALGFATHLRSLGIRLTFHQENASPALPIALGGVGTRLFEITGLYCALANGGLYQPLSYFKNAIKLPTQVLVTPEAARWVQMILEEAPLPEGWVDWHLTHHKPVAYKTGTSYGFRDALAIGFTEEYTVSVWVGRPDGTAASGYTGRTHAAPLLFKIFGLLPQSLLNIKGSKSYDSATLWGKPPQHLLEFKRASAQSTADAFKIVFPKNGTTLSIEQKQSIPITFTGGKGPFYVYENNRPIGKITKHEILWKPKSTGFWELTILDSEGQSASSTIRIQ